MRVMEGHVSVEMMNEGVMFEEMQVCVRRDRKVLADVGVEKLAMLLPSQRIVMFEVEVVVERVEM